MVHPDSIIAEIYLGLHMFMIESTCCFCGVFCLQRRGEEQPVVKLVIHLAKGFHYAVFSCANGEWELIEGAAPSKLLPLLKDLVANTPATNPMMVS